MNDINLYRDRLYFLSVPDSKEHSFGYGLTLRPDRKDRLVGLLMLNHPAPVDLLWFVKLEDRFGESKRYPMNASGELGVACQMLIRKESLPYLRQEGNVEEALANLMDYAITPDFQNLPRAMLETWWEDARYSWVRQVQKPRFPIGQTVATPGAIAALKNANIDPTLVFARHHMGDWGDALPIEDWESNELNLIHGGRLVSSYLLNTGVKIWLISEADFSVTTNFSITTALLPSEY